MIGGMSPRQTTQMSKCAVLHHPHGRENQSTGAYFRLHPDVGGRSRIDPLKIIRVDAKVVVGVDGSMANVRTTQRVNIEREEMESLVHLTIEGLIHHPCTMVGCDVTMEKHMTCSCDYDGNTLRVLPMTKPC